MKQVNKNRLSREKIITAAIADFNESGCCDIHINNICKNNHISKGLLYHYFQSKDELFHDCLIYVTELLAADIDAFQINTEISLAQNLHNFYEERILYWRKNNEQYDIIKFAIGCYYFSDNSKFLDMHEIFANANNTKLREMLDAYELNLEVSKDDLLTVMDMVFINKFMGAMSEIVSAERNNHIRLADEKSKELLKLYDGLINLLLHGIKNDD